MRQLTSSNFVSTISSVELRIGNKKLKQFDNEVIQILEFKIGSLTNRQISELPIFAASRKRAVNLIFSFYLFGVVTCSSHFFPDLINACF